MSVDQGIFESSNKNNSNEKDQLFRKDEYSNVSIISVVENRAREVCISRLDTQNSSVLELYLITDNNSYSETLLCISTIKPDEILLHDGNRNKTLSKLIENHCHDECRVLYISRQYFDQDRGADMLKKVLVGEVDGDMIAKYIVLSGAFCLLRYFENCSGGSIAPNSIRVEYGSSGAKRMNIDRRTALNLELITNAKTGNQKESLFGAINNTKTVCDMIDIKSYIVGARLLKSNILRPITDVNTLNTRLDVVELLLKYNNVFVEVVAALQTFPDLDKMLSGLTTIPKNVTPKTARSGIDTLIYLKQALTSGPMLANALNSIGSREPKAIVGGISAAQSGNPSGGENLLSIIIDNLRNNSQLSSILDKISAIFTESTTYSKSNQQMRHQECFALRNGIHGLLDVARKTFLQTVEDMHTMADEYSNHYNVPIKVVHNASRGYYLSVPTALTPFPNIFNQAVLNKKSISCSTEEFTELANRADAAITSALSITHKLIQDTLSSIRDEIECLFKLTDSVALLDMLTSCADMVALSPHPFCRPHLTTDGPISITAGRHPVITTINLQKLTSSFIPNDLYFSSTENFHILTGPNCSGKSIYIKQTALILILAQIGSFVPAQRATISVRDRILSRIGSGDDMEHNMSTFAIEMKETAYIVDHVTPKSFILIDELGRGTSNIDGLSIAFAVAEHLAETEAFTLFVTHYPQTTSLPTVYPNVKNIHMKTSLDFIQPSSHSSREGIHFLHQIGSGPFDLKNGYGILMAEQCGFPEEFIRIARNYRKLVKNQFPILMEQKPIDWMESSLSRVFAVVQEVLKLKGSDLDDVRLCEVLNELRSKVSDDEAKLMLRYLNGEMELATPHKKRMDAMQDLSNELSVQTDSPFVSRRLFPDADEIQANEPLVTNEESRMKMNSNQLSIGISSTIVPSTVNENTQSKSLETSNGHGVIELFTARKKDRF